MWLLDKLSWHSVDISKKDVGDLELPTEGCLVARKSCNESGDWSDMSHISRKLMNKEMKVNIWVTNMELLFHLDMEKCIYVAKYQLEYL